LTAKDPTAAVIAFLGVEVTWREINERQRALQSFLEANRHKEFARSRRLVELITNHPVPDGHASDAAISQARKDMDAIIQDKSVVERWTDYRNAFDQANVAYREIYQQAYDKIRRDVEEAVASIRSGEAYKQAPNDQRDQVVDAIFAPGRVCHYPEISIASVVGLIEAAGRRSLTSLDQARVALPGYCAQVEADLRKLAAPPSKPDEKVFEWRATNVLAGRRLVTEPEVDEAFEQAAKNLQGSADELKARIREGFTVMVK